MDARQATARQAGGDGAITTRIGAVALPLGSIVILVSEYSHPFREDPMDNPVVFTEYAQTTSSDRTGSWLSEAALAPREDLTLPVIPSARPAGRRQSIF
jgi:hypothetical protein